MKSTVTTVKKISISERPTEQLRPAARNAQAHSARQINQNAAAGTQEFGFVNPILPANGALAGDRRLGAAKKLDVVRIPVIVVLDHLTETQ